MGSSTLPKFTGFALVAFWMATVIATDRFRSPSSFHLMASLFVLWNAVSIFWSADVNRTLIQVLTWFQLLALSFILWDLYTTRKAILAGLQAYILGVAVLVSNMIFNYLSGTTFYYERFSAAGTNPDDVGVILALGLPVAWYLAVSKTTTKMSYVLKWVNYAYIPAAFLGIILSGTRTALIASIPAMAFGLASLTRLRLAFRIAIFVLLAAIVLISLPYVETLPGFQRLGTIGHQIAEGDLNQRQDIWREGLASFLAHPLIGVGSNMYRSTNSLGKVAHNSFISVLVELGLIGFALFASMLAIAVNQAWNQPRWEARFWLTILAVWAIGASTLTWEYRKPTWLFLSLLITNAALTSTRSQKLGVRSQE